ncbi:MAG TPA: RIO1 family regulatory kinase/ATPase [Chthonomonadaceae bacterium]|nr:RIO1 family regulatory kinase/ATPase [Chthonomonadaceae bacterium]
MTEDYFEKYAYLEEEPVRRASPKAPRPVVREALTDGPETQDGLQTTYTPSRFEEGWLLSSLTTFYQQDLLCDILSYVKGGKEASVYCCVPGPAAGPDLIAAKVYRPREFRNLRNDAMYREGRPVLSADGKPIKKTDHRAMRALGKKTEFGVQLQHTSWLMYEFTAMQSFYAAGACVPRPIAAGENAILMGYQGDAQRPAPALSEVSLDRKEAAALLKEALRSIEVMLQQGYIHGDLSAYNILYWEGKITLIDFPQVTSLEANRNAHFILQRDITRVCDYFARQGASSDPQAVMETLWNRYGNREPVYLEET